MAPKYGNDRYMKVYPEQQTVSPLGPGRPDWVKQEDFDLANAELMKGGEAEQNMRNFLEWVAQFNPKPNLGPELPAAAARRLQQASPEAQLARNVVESQAQPNIVQTLADTAQKQASERSLVEMLSPTVNVSQGTNAFVPMGGGDFAPQTANRGMGPRAKSGGGGGGVNPIEELIRQIMPFARR